MAEYTDPFRRTPNPYKIAEQQAQQGGQANQMVGTPPSGAPAQAPTPQWAPPQPGTTPPPLAQPANYQTYFGAAPQGSVAQNLWQGAPATSPALTNLASQFAQQAGYQSQPNVQAQKAQALQFAQNAYQQGMDQSRMSAAQRGTLGSGQQGSMERDAYDRYIGGLGNAYNQIQQGAEQRGFENLLGTSSALGNLANMISGNELQGRGLDIQKELGLGNIDVNRMVGLGNIGLGDRRLLEEARQYDKGFGLQERQFGLAESQAGAANTAAQRAYDLQMANAQAGQQRGILDLLMGLF
ncbi:MAG TPA: hypothetical protein VJA25_06775 [Dehalococcoidia bacterium]|nr:hypothetical protein [Dehalococcoidia bacterium]